MLPNEVFFSHASLDRPFADQLVSVLRRHGVPIWYSQTNIRGAQQWHDEIGAALKRCDWFLLAVSPHSVESKWVKRELMYALQRDRFEERIIPLLHQPCDQERLSWTLLSIHSIDFTQDFEAGCRNLLRVWGLGYQP